MLDAAGVKDLSMKIWAMPVQRPYNPNARRMAELMQADFAAIGVKAEIVSIEWGEYLAQSSAKDRDGAVLLGWTGDNGDPDNFLGVLLGCDAVGGQQPGAMVQPGLRGPAPEGQAHRRTRPSAAKLYEQAQVIFKEQAPWVTIAHSIVFMPMRKRSPATCMDPLGIHRFDGVDIDRVARSRWTGPAARPE